jgi:hypothetical protein
MNKQVEERLGMLVDVALRMHDWLREQNIPVEAFRMVLSFPSMDDKMKAEGVIRRELQGMARYAAPGFPTKHIQLYGIDIRLESRRDK